MRQKFSLPWIVLSVLLITAWCASADTASQHPEAFLPESVFEFKPVVEGTEVAHAFAIYNRGDAPLKILDIKSG